MFDAQRLEVHRQVPVIPMYLKDAPVVSQVAPGNLQRLGVSIDTDESSVRTQLLQDRRCVTATAECCVDDDAPRMRLEELENFM